MGPSGGFRLAIGRSQASLRKKRDIVGWILIRNRRTAPRAGALEFHHNYGGRLPSELAPIDKSRGDFTPPPDFWRTAPRRRRPPQLHCYLAYRRSCDFSSDESAPPSAGGQVTEVYYKRPASRVCRHVHLWPPATPARELDQKSRNRRTLRTVGNRPLVRQTWGSR